MRFGTGFPHAIGTDPDLIRCFVQSIEQAGFDDLLVIEHVAGGHPDRLQGPIGGMERAPYTHGDPFHEVLTLLAFTAGLTTRIGLVTNVLVTYVLVLPPARDRPRRQASRRDRSPEPRRCPSRPWRHPRHPQRRPPRSPLDRHLELLLEAKRLLAG